MNTKHLTVDTSNAAWEIFGFDREMRGSEHRVTDSQRSKTTVCLQREAIERCGSCGAPAIQGAGFCYSCLATNWKPATYSERQQKLTEEYMNIKYLIVDGSNAAREIFGFGRDIWGNERRVLDNQHSKSLLSVLAAFPKRLGIPEIKVYFDGTVRPHEICPRNLPMSVRLEFGAGTAADELIVREAGALVNSAGGIAVVTNDRDLGNRVKGLGVFKVLPVWSLKAMAQDAGLNTDLYFHSA
ncbi:MAG TPA: hypothetical protein DCL44_11410 [Elusimicrobia bacterium]|nr:hypothetical protein [Elusimicrobiota bacterium]